LIYPPKRPGGAGYGAQTRGRGRDPVDLRVVREPGWFRRWRLGLDSDRAIARSRPDEERHVRRLLGRIGKVLGWIADLF